MSIPRSNAATSRRKPTNVSLDADLVRTAKALGLNVSRVAEAALEEAVRRHRREAWQRDNATAIDRYNKRVENDGVFSDRLRRF